MFDNNSAFGSLVSKEHLEMCNIAYDMIKNVYSEKRVKNAMSDPEKSAMFAQTTLEDQDAIIQYISDGVTGIEKTDAVIICHLLFGIHMGLSGGPFVLINKDVIGIIEDTILMIINKYNQED